MPACAPPDCSRDHVLFRPVGSQPAVREPTLDSPDLHMGSQEIIDAYKLLIFEGKFLLTFKKQFLY